jgi:hypothetical protein
MKQSESVVQELNEINRNVPNWDACGFFFFLDEHLAFLPKLRDFPSDGFAIREEECLCRTIVSRILKRLFASRMGRRVVLGVGER